MKKIVLAVGGLIVIGAVAYAMHDAWQPPGAVAESTPITTSESSTRIGSVASFLPGLEAKVASDPDDGTNWLLLAKSYRHLGRTDDAQEAYAQAVALGFTDPTFGQASLVQHPGGDDLTQIARWVADDPSTPDPQAEVE